MITAVWRKLGRYHALVEINTRLPHAELHERHGSVFETVEPLIERGQRERAAASAELSAGRMPAEEVEAALVTTLLGAIGSGP